MWCVSKSFFSPHIILGKQDRNQRHHGRFDSGWIRRVRQFLHDKRWLCRSDDVCKSPVTSVQVVFLSEGVGCHSLPFSLRIVRLFLSVDRKQHDDTSDSFLEEADGEGRVLLSEYDNGYLLNVYFPAGVEWM